MEWSNAVLGALVGGLLTTAGFVYKRRLENLAIYNRSLYQLLTLYRSINSAAFKPSIIAKLIVEVLHEVFPGAENDPSMKGAEELYNGLLSKLFSEAFPEEKQLLPIYLEAVEKLSVVDPVLAYRLSGNAVLKRYLVAADEQTQQLRNLAVDELSEKDLKTVDKCNTEASDQLSRDIIRELKIDLLILSLRCGVTQFISVARRMLIRQGISESERLKVEGNDEVVC